MDGDSKPPSQDAVDSIVLEEEIDPNYVPSEPEVVEYAKWMGMDLDKDQDLFWIAREGLMAPLPKDWKPCRTKDTEDIYYFNFSTGDSTWDHPCDGYYKRLYEEEKKKKETVIKESGDQNRSKAKQDVEQLLGKADKKKSKKVPRTLSDIDMVKALPTPLSLQKAPLPGINNPLRMSAPSNLGPLSSGGGSGGAVGDILGGMSSKGTQLLRHSDADMKLTSNLNGSKSISSRDPSPLGRLQLETADTKPAFESLRQRVDPTGEAKDSKDDASELEKSMGRLDVTSSLSSKSRVLTGTSGTASKLRAALPGVSGGSDEWHHSPSEDKPVDVDRCVYTDDEKDDRARFVGTSVEVRARSSPPTLSNSSDVRGTSSTSTSSLVAEVENHKSRCIELERRVEENEARVADYKASYNTAKEDLLALERRYESNQSQWLDRVRLVEVEKDKIENDRRQLKLALLDLESAPKPLSTPEPVLLENEQLRREIYELKLQFQSAEASLARSTAEQAVLQQRLNNAEVAEQERISWLQTDYNVVVGERANLALQLEECKRSLNEARSATLVLSARDQDQAEDLLRKLRQEKDQKEAEIQNVLALLLEEQRQHADARELLKNVEDSHNEKRSLQDQAGAVLQDQLDSTLETLGATRTELDRQCISHRDSERELVGKVEAADAQLKEAQATIQELQAVILHLRSELSEKDKKLSDQQELLLTLQASSNLNSSNDNDKSAQFEVFVSQATAIRKSLKSEIDRQKVQLLELESEKSSLVTQLTRQETTLQFAKKELNASASLTESNRQLEAENQQLNAQLDIIRTSSARQAEHEFQLKEKYEKLLQTRREEEEILRALQQENSRMVLTLDQERTFGAQSEKKIKSYQEELLQLQRRLAEKTSPQKSFRKDVDGLVPIGSTSPASSPTPFLTSDNTAMLLDVQNQLMFKQTELDRATQQLSELAARFSSSEEHRRQSERVVDALNSRVSQLQEQLRASALRMSDFGADQVDAYNTSMRERDQMEQEKMAFELQLQALQFQLSAALSNLQTSGITAERLEAEVKSYREKWLECEKQLTAARLSLSTGSAGAEATLGSLRGELREALAALQFSKTAEDSMRSQVAELRKALVEQDEVIKNLRVETFKTTAIVSGENKENLNVPTSDDLPSSATSESIRALPQDLRHSLEQRGSDGQQHIVALSLEVGRQQATMERLEQHIRNTEVILQEIKYQGSKKHVAGFITTPTSSDTRDVRTEEAARDSSTPDSQSLLLANHTTKREAEFSSSPARKNRNRQRAAKLVQFQIVGKEKYPRTAAAEFAEADLVDLMDIKDKISTLIEEMDMDVHDCTTLRGWTRGDETSKAQRVLAEGKSRLKKETKFLKEVQIICLTAKQAIGHNQECVKNLKAAWRNARNGDSGRMSSSMTTENVNSVTLKVNGAVDELREMQQLTKARENRINSLHQSVQYLEQLTHSAHGNVDASHLIEVMELVQQKCIESAAELEAVTGSLRAKGRSIASGDRFDKVGAPAATGVAFSEVKRTQANTVLEDRSARRNNPICASPAEIFDAYHQPGLTEYPSAHQSSKFSNLPIPMYSTAPPHKQISIPVSVSGMRNSDLKNRILQDQIARIAERQSLSKAVCEKHAGWLSDLGKEISGAAHGASTATGRVASTESFAASLQAHKEKHTAKLGASSDVQYRTFGTTLQNHAHQSSAIDELLEKL